MGVTAAIVGTALAVGASAYSSHKQAKAQKNLLINLSNIQKLECRYMDR